VLLTIGNPRTGHETCTARKTSCRCVHRVTCPTKAGARASVASPGSGQNESLGESNNSKKSWQNEIDQRGLRRGGIHSPAWVLKVTQNARSPSRSSEFRSASWRERNSTRNGSGRPALRQVSSKFLHSSSRLDLANGERITSSMIATSGAWRGANFFERPLMGAIEDFAPGGRVLVRRQKPITRGGGNPVLLYCARSRLALSIAIGGPFPRLK